MKRSILWSGLGFTSLARCLPANLTPQSLNCYLPSKHQHTADLCTSSFGNAAKQHSLDGRGGGRGCDAILLLSSGLWVQGQGERDKQ